MPFLSFLKGLVFEPEAAQVETKADVVYPVTNPTETRATSVYAYASSTFASTLNRKDASMSVIFLTILHAIQTTAKSIPWNVYQLQKDENAQKAIDHPFADLIYRPNPQQSWSDFITQYIGHFLSTGNVFIYAVRLTHGLNKGQARELYIMPLDTEVITGQSWRSKVEAYRAPSGNGNFETFKPEEVIHVKRFKLGDTVYGLSPITAGALPLTAADYGMRQRIKQLKSGGPSTVFFPDQSADVEGTPDLTPEQEADLVRSIASAEQYKYLSTKVGTAQIGVSPADLQLLDSIKADAGMVADLLGYPSILLSSTDGNTFSNVEAATKALYNNCVLPLLHELRDSLNHKLGGSYKDKVYLDMDLSGIEVLKPNTAELLKAANDSPFLSINDRRKMAGFAAIKGGDGFIRIKGTSYVATIDEKVEAPASKAAPDAVAA